MTTDIITRPQHYQGANGLQVLHVIEEWGLGYHLGNVVKYILRAHRKGDEVRDLEKARYYCELARAASTRRMPLIVNERRPRLVPSEVAIAFDLPGGGGGARARALHEVFTAALAPVGNDGRAAMLRAEAHLGTALEQLA